MFTLFFASDTFVRILSTIALKAGAILRMVVYLRHLAKLTQQVCLIYFVMVWNQVNQEIKL